MLYAVTSYFNPCRYRKRIENYHLFQRNLHVPLVTIEQGFDGCFDLSPEDADIYVSLDGGDIMFQKERLLNIAAAHLPDDCTAVAWLDCDILFSDSAWAERTMELLETHDVVQPFATLYPLEQESPVSFRLARRFLSAHPSIPAYLAANLPRRRSESLCASDWQAPEGTRTRFRTGIAWATRRDFFEQVGLYDACILGSGDMAFSSALFNCPEVAIDRYRMGPECEQHFREWFHQLQHMFPLRVGGLDTEVLQLWHGSYTNRKYRQRHADFARFDFRPQHDLIAEPGHCWRWRDPNSPMARFVRRYFISRQEDGLPTPPPPALSTSTPGFP